MILAALGVPPGAWTLVDFGDDHMWTGSFRFFLFEENEEMLIPASAVRERTGMASPDVELIQGKRSYQVVRPYHVRLTVEFPGKPAVLECRIEEVLQTVPVED